MKQYNHVQKLQDYMLTNKTLEQARSFIISPSKLNGGKKSEKFTNNMAKTTNFDQKDIDFTPNEKDGLFWCFYILENGLDSYKMLNGKNFSIEQAYKISFIEQIKKENELWKEQGIKKTILETDLTGSLNAKLSLTSLKALCILKKVNIILVDKKCYYEYIYNPDNPVGIIHIKNGAYVVELEMKKMDEIFIYRNNYLQITDINKKIKGIGSYKLAELKNIAEKLDIDIKTKKTKTILYEEILSKI